MMGDGELTLANLMRETPKSFQPRRLHGFRAPVSTEAGGRAESFR